MLETLACLKSDRIGVKVKFGGSLGLFGIRGECLHVVLPSLEGGPGEAGFIFFHDDEYLIFHL